MTKEQKRSLNDTVNSSYFSESTNNSFFLIYSYNIASLQNLYKY